MSKKNDKLNEFRKHPKEQQLSIINISLLEHQENGKTNQYEIRGNIEIVDKILDTDDSLTEDEISFVKQLYRNSNLIKDSLNNNRGMAKTCAFRMYPDDYELFRDYCRVNKLKVQDAIGIALRDFCFKEK